MTHIFGFALIFFTVCILLHWLLTRLTSGKAFVRNGYLFFLTMCLLSAIAVVPNGWRLAGPFYLFAVILWNSYSTFFVNLMNSVSLRIMVEIDQSEGQSLSGVEILNLYSDETALESRLREMATSGLLRFAEDQLVLTRKGRLLARVLVLIRRIFGIEFFG
jgi:hypothetical protein